jgi:hypothetical protein
MDSGEIGNPSHTSVRVNVKHINAVVVSHIDAASNAIDGYVIPLALTANRDGSQQSARVGLSCDS